jgi:hypothetical protein
MNTWRTHRLDVLRRLGQAAVVDRHVAPAEQHLAFVADGTLDHRLAGTPAGVAARQEHHAHAVLPAGGRVTPCFAISSRRNWSGIWIRMPAPSPSKRVVAGGAAMLEVLQDLQALLDDGVALSGS